MKTYEVRFMEEDGTVTSTFYQAENAERLFDFLRVMGSDLFIVGYNVLGG